MGAFSDYLENKLLDHTLRNTTYTPPSTVYVALFTSTATGADLEAGTITNELAGGSYARQAVTFTAASGSSTSNNAAVTFGPLPAATIRFVAIMDASTSGNVLYFSQLGSDVTTVSGDSFQINTSNLTIQLD